MVLLELRVVVPLAAVVVAEHLLDHRDPLLEVMVVRQVLDTMVTVVVLVVDKVILLGEVHL